MVAMKVVQVPVMDEIHVVAMLHGEMLLALVAVGMAIGGHPDDQFLGIGIGIAHLEDMLVDMPAMRVVKVAIVEVIDMTIVVERLMAAALAVDMAFVTAMQHLVRHHRLGNQGKRQHGAGQGSMHRCALRKR
jgi:hypothetical protein